MDVHSIFFSKHKCMIKNSGGCCSKQWSRGKCNFLSKETGTKQWFMKTILVPMYRIVPSITTQENRMIRSLEGIFHTVRLLEPLLPPWLQKDDSLWSGHLRSFSKLWNTSLTQNELVQTFSPFVQSRHWNSGTGFVQTLEFRPWELQSIIRHLPVRLTIQMPLVLHLGERERSGLVLCLRRFFKEWDYGNLPSFLFERSSSLLLVTIMCKLVSVQKKVLCGYM